MANSIRFTTILSVFVAIVAFINYQRSDKDPTFSRKRRTMENVSHHFTESPPPRCPIDPTQTFRMALTFEKTPSPYTSTILDKLLNLGYKATFFIDSGNMGSSDQRALIERMVNEGHTAALRLDRNLVTTSMSVNDIVNIIVAQRNALNAITNVTAKWIRINDWNQLEEQVFRAIFIAGLYPVGYTLNLYPAENKTYIISTYQVAFNYWFNSSNYRGQQNINGPIIIHQENALLNSSMNDIFSQMIFTGNGIYPPYTPVNMDYCLIFPNSSFANEYLNWSETTLTIPIPTATSTQSPNSAMSMILQNGFFINWVVMMLLLYLIAV